MTVILGITTIRMGGFFGFGAGCWCVDDSLSLVRASGYKKAIRRLIRRL